MRIIPDRFENSYAMLEECNKLVQMLTDIRDVLKDYDTQCDYSYLFEGIPQNFTMLNTIATRGIETGATARLIEAFNDINHAHSALHQVYAEGDNSAIDIDLIRCSIEHALGSVVIFMMVALELFRIPGGTCIESVAKMCTARGIPPLEMWKTPRHILVGTGIDTRAYEECSHMYSAMARDYPELLLEAGDKALPLTTSLAFQLVSGTVPFTTVQEKIYKQLRGTPSSVTSTPLPKMDLK